MSTIKLTATGGGGGTVSLKAPAAPQSNGAVELTLPTDDGSADQYLKTNGSGVLSFATVSAGLTQWDSAWAATTSGTEHIITGIPATASHVRILADGMKFSSDNHAMRFTLGYGDASSSSYTETGYKYTGAHLYDSGQSVEGSSNNTYIRAYGLNDLDYDRYHQIDLYKLNVANKWSIRYVAHYWNNESSGSMGTNLYWTFGHVTLGGTLYKVKAGATTFGAGAFKLQAWY